VVNYWADRRLFGQERILRQSPSLVLAAAVAASVDTRLDKSEIGPSKYLSILRRNLKMARSTFRRAAYDGGEDTVVGSNAAPGYR
jgi:hypothetical protein